MQNRFIMKSQIHKTILQWRERERKKKSPKGTRNRNDYEKLMNKWTIRISYRIELIEANESRAKCDRELKQLFAVLWQRLEWFNISHTVFFLRFSRSFSLRLLSIFRRKIRRREEKEKNEKNFWKRTTLVGNAKCLIAFMRFNLHFDNDNDKRAWYTLTEQRWANVLNVIGGLSMRSANNENRVFYVYHCHFRVPNVLVYVWEKKTEHWHRLQILFICYYLFCNFVLSNDDVDVSVFFL